MRKIVIELQIDWEGYEDVPDELIVEDAIEAKVEGVWWTLLSQPPVTGSVCEHPYASLVGEEHGNPKCLKCGKNLNEQTDL